MKQQSTSLGCVLLAAVLGGGSTAVAQPMPAIDATERRGLNWLVGCQHKDGGWGFSEGAGASDPGMTAYAGLALIRAGIDHKDDRYRAALKRATPWLLEAVRKAPDTGPAMGNSAGESQLHYKLGQFVDASLCAQFFARLQPHITEPDELIAIREAASKCLRKLESSQSKDGGWGRGGWAAVLQTGLAAQTFEVANLAGLEVDPDVERRAREVLRTGKAAPPPKIDSPGEEGSGDSTKVEEEAPNQATPAMNNAGVELYSMAARTRACARDVLAARRLLGEKDLTLGNLQKAGVPDDRAIEMVAAYEVHLRVLEKIKTKGKKANAFLKGFGNRGGEEVISYLLISESLVGAEDPEFPEWRMKVESLLKGSQNPDGSWVGHHCLTSPTAVTAASVLCLTADREPQVFDPNLAGLRATTKDTEPWELVTLPRHGTISVKRVAWALAKAVDEAEIRELLPIAEAAVKALGPDGRPRLALMLSTELETEHASVQAWSEANTRELVGAETAEQVGAWLNRTRDLMRAGSAGDPGVLDELTATLGDSNAGLPLQRLALDALVHLQAFPAVETLISELRDEDLEHREHSWRALGALAGAREPFVPDAHPAVRTKQVKAWERWADSAQGRAILILGERETLTRAVDRLADRDPTVSQLARAILRSRGEKAIAVLTEGLAEEATRLASYALLLELSGRRHLPASYQAWVEAVPRAPKSKVKAEAAVTSWLKSGEPPPAWLDASAVAVDLESARKDLSERGAFVADDERGRLSLALARVELRLGNLGSARRQLERAAIAGPDATAGDALLLQGVAAVLSRPETDPSWTALREQTPLPKVQRLVELAPWLPVIHEAHAFALNRTGAIKAARGALRSAMAWSADPADHLRLSEVSAALSAKAEPSTGDQ